jgi:hypothetical protein
MSSPPHVLHGATRIRLGLAALGRPAHSTASRAIELASDRSLEGCAPASARFSTQRTTPKG